MCPDKLNGCGALLLVSMLPFSMTASALDMNGNVSADARYTSNAGLASATETDDIVATGRIGALISEDEGPLTGNARFALSYIDYLDNTFGSQTYLQLAANANWVQIDNVLEWNVSDYYSQTSVNNLAGDIPTNTQDINAFSASAGWALYRAGRHIVTLTPAFQDYYYESSNNDNQQVGLSAVWSYQLRPTVSLSLAGNYRDVNYDNDTIEIGITDPDYSSTGLNVGIDAQRARAEYSASIGATKIERDSGNDTDGLVARIAASYTLSGRSSLDVLLSTNITDTSNVFLATALDPNAGNFGNVQTSSDVLRNNLARVAYNLNVARSSLSAWVELRKLDYEISPIDRKVQEYGASFGYGLTSRLSTSLRGRYTETELTNTSLNQTDTYYTVDGQLDYDLSRKMNIHAGARFQNRDNTNPLAVEYDEYSVFAGINYRFGANSRIGQDGRFGQIPGSIGTH